MEIDHEIFSTVILSLPMIQEGQLSVSGERMYTILVNRLEDYACPANVWLGKLTALDMTHWVDWAVKPQHKETKNLTCIIHLLTLFQSLNITYYFISKSANVKFSVTIDQTICSLYHIAAGAGAVWRP